MNDWLKKLAQRFTGFGKIPPLPRGPAEEPDYKETEKPSPEPADAPETEAFKDPEYPNWQRSVVEHERPAEYVGPSQEYKDKLQARRDERIAQATEANPEIETFEFSGEATSTNMEVASPPKGDVAAEPPVSPPAAPSGPVDVAEPPTTTDARPDVAEPPVSRTAVPDVLTPPDTPSHKPPVAVEPVTRPSSIRDLPNLKKPIPDDLDLPDISEPFEESQSKQSAQNIRTDELGGAQEMLLETQGQSADAQVKSMQLMAEFAEATTVQFEHAYNALHRIVERGLETRDTLTD